MIRNIWILLAKKLNGEATEEELRELDQLIEQSGYLSGYDELEALFNEKDSRDKASHSADLEKKWDRLNTIIDSLEETPPAEQARTGYFHKLRIRRIMLYAAVLALFSAAGYILMTNPKPAPGVTSVMAPANGVSKILLPDGSSVWLNCGSKLSYQNNPETQCREVNLTGEAYFDVVKDAEHPFIVKTTNFNIRVLGTAFNVRSYDKDKTAEATLVRGRIELTMNKNPSQKYILKPSERFSMGAQLAPAMHKDTIGSAKELKNVMLTKITEHKIEGLPSEVLWTKSVIDFDNTEFEDVARMMEHKYNVAIEFRDDDAKRLKFTGKFRNESMEEALNDLKTTANFHYRIEGDKVFISE